MRFVLKFLSLIYKVSSSSWPVDQFAILILRAVIIDNGQNSECALHSGVIRENTTMCCWLLSRRRAVPPWWQQREPELSSWRERSCREEETRIQLTEEECALSMLQQPKVSLRQERFSNVIDFWYNYDLRWCTVQLKELLFTLSYHLRCWGCCRHTRPISTWSRRSGIRHCMQLQLKATSNAAGFWLREVRFT